MFRPIALYNSLKLLTIIVLIGMCAPATLGHTKCENKKCDVRLCYSLADAYRLNDDNKKGEQLHSPFLLTFHV